MAVERVPGGSSLIDVLDRVLDKGIVIDAWMRISLAGIDLITVEARIVVASIDTYLKYADRVGALGLVGQLPGVEVRETTVQDRGGRWYSLRIRPYKTMDNKIDGAVLILIDVDQLRRMAPLPN